MHGVMAASFGNIFTSGGGGGGSGVAGGRTFIVQNSGSDKADADSNGLKSFAMDANFTAGNSAIVTLSWYTGGTGSVSSVSVNGTAATKANEGVGTGVNTEIWFATGLSGGGATVEITFGAGSGYYWNANCVEVGPLSGEGNEVDGNASATDFGPSMASPTQCETISAGVWRDNDGITNTASPQIDSPGVLGFYNADGVASLGGASGFISGQRIEAQAVGFNASPSATAYFVGQTFHLALPLTRAGGTSKFWTGDTTWNPATVSHAVDSTAKTLVTLGAWWNSNLSPGGAPGALPTDNNGTFTAAINPACESGEEPIVCQICYQSSPAVATHVVTPPSVADSGDGYFALLEIPGLATSSVLRDSGYIRDRHAPVSPPDPASIQTITVETDGSLAEVGDIAVAAFVMDPNSTSQTDVKWVPPSGWYVLDNKFNLTDNVGALFCCAKVTTAGKISVTATWTDPNTFFAGAAIAVFKHV